MSSCGLSRAPDLTYRRWRAPIGQGSVLIDPPWPSLVDNPPRPDRSEVRSQYSVQGRSLAELAQLARAELHSAALLYTRSYRDARVPLHSERIYLAGHQPELFHPGVWFKNFVLGRLGELHDALPVNLLIDSDTMKLPAIRVPTSRVERPELSPLAFDAATDEMPFENRPIIDHSLLESFGDRVCDLVSPFVREPFARQFWPLVVGRSRETNNLGQCLAQARHQWEGRWGLQTLELPQSRVCQFQAFHWFAAHLLANIDRLRDTYNTSILDYRRVMRVRSANHPVPLLDAAGEWREAPFWVWTRDAPRRARLFVRQSGSKLELSDRRHLSVTLTLAVDADGARAATQLAELHERGICLRTRALTTTLFARLFLGDLFLHGIGGAKYDQLTDLLIGRFFGWQPPPIAVCSATLQLPIARDAISPEDARRVDRQLRELTYQPDRFLANAGESSDECQRLCETKARLLAQDPAVFQTREFARRVRQVNSGLQSFVTERRAELLAERELLADRLRAESLLASREFSFCLHPDEKLRGFLLEFPARTS